MSTASRDSTVVLITGSNTGVGYATIQAILSEPKDKKYSIIMCSRSLERGQTALENLKKDENINKTLSFGSEVIPMQLDIDDEESVQRLRKDVEERFGKVDVLVNNAGVNLDFVVQQGNMTVREAFLKTYNTNVVSTHIFTSTFIELILKSQNRRIIFISSGISSLGDHSNPKIPVNQSPPAGWPKPDMFATTTYRTSKTGLNMMVLEWKRVLKNDGIKIHLVEPGFLVTGLGGVGKERLVMYGAKDPIEGGRFVFKVINGERDEDEGKLVAEFGVIPW